jgi:hypothetical protein
MQGEKVVLESSEVAYKLFDTAVIRERELIRETISQSVDRKLDRCRKKPNLYVVLFPQSFCFCGNTDRVKTYRRYVNFKKNPGQIRDEQQQVQVRTETCP